jgi:fatty-acyl-CoA synthase
MEMHFATIWESIADAVPEHTAIVQGDRRVSWADYDETAARLAQAFLDAGLGADSKVAMFLYNSPEYVETQFAALKIRGVPVNVNYRYLDDELYYLLDNADAEAIVFHTSLAPRIAAVRDRLPKLKLAVQVDDGGEALADVPHYADLVTATEPAERIPRAWDDTYMFYTGGTTGMPKGVMYEIGHFTEQFVSQMPMFLGLEPIDGAEGAAPAARRLVDEGRAMVAMSGPPLMHGTGCWLGQMAPQLFGATAVLSASRSFDADDILTTVANERVNQLIIVGDAFARPMLRRLDELEADGDTSLDLSSLAIVISSGAMWATEVKQGLLRHIPHAMLIDVLGSTEGGMAMNITTADNATETAKFSAQPTTKVFDEDDNEVEPGSGTMGMVATSGIVPVGYYKDTEKSDRTFRTIDGVRWSFPGDWALVEADGTMTLLGRGSQCINSGGEKIFPEEVEEAVKAHDAVADCLIFGEPDERFGERVVGVVSLEPGTDIATSDLREAARDHLASFKLPKELVIVDEIPRSPNGKADYPQAKELFTGANS